MDDLRYALRIELTADSLAYSGRVSISARELPRSLTLDTIGHSIRSVTSGGTAVPFHPRTAPPGLEVGPIPTGARSIEIEYTGAADDRGVRGLFVSPLGAGRLLSTYFEPAAARRFLPCLDRPDAKAVFELEVVAPSELTVLTNTSSVATERLPDGRTRTRFAPTPPMATYLLYLAVGPLEQLEGSAPGPKVILAAAVGRTSSGRDSIQHAERSLAYFADYYAEPYPLPKLHLIAVPQFGTGAMENWGAIASQESYLLHDAQTTLAQRRATDEVISHEVAHMWFGDLVTMRWWDDLWLNESFATFVAAKAMETLAPESKAMERLLAGRISGAMSLDALPHTHPIQVAVREPEEIRQIFDDISYGKGAGVLRMAEAHVGEAAFRRGVSAYLRAHRYGNATAGDLWTAVAAASEPAVERLFGEWVARPGFPVVRVRRNGSQLELEQAQFGVGPEEPAKPWPIPLSIRTGGEARRLLFDTPRTSVPAGSGTPVVNPGRSGFYRVEYDRALRTELLAAWSELPPLDRWGLLNDGLALFLAGTITLDEYLELLRPVVGETEPFVVTGALAALETGFLSVVGRLPKWRDALRAIVVAQTERLGAAAADGEPERVRSLRESVTMTRVVLDPAFAESLATEFDRLDRVDPERVRPILVAYARRAGEPEYRGLRERLAAASTAGERMRWALALGAVPNDAWVEECLGLLLEGKLLVEPWLTIFQSVLSLAPERSGAVWAFLTKHVDALKGLFAGSPILLGILRYSLPVVGLGRSAEVKRWVAAQSFPESGRAVTTGLDVLDVLERVLARAA